MTTPRTTPSVPSWLRDGLHIFIVLLLSLSALACSSPFKKPPESAEQAMLDAADERKRFGVQPGDVRIINGVEWVWGRNVKYMMNPSEPQYVWVPREMYAPTLGDTVPGRVGYPTKKSKETTTLEERLAKLEAQMRGLPPPKTPPPDQPVKDATGKAWVRYFRNDDGIEWFMEEAKPTVSESTVTLWRKRTFPTWAFQKEIVTLDDINCRQAKYRTRELRVTNWDGSTQTSDKVTSWAQIHSNSAEDYLMGELCK